MNKFISVLSFALLLVGFAACDPEDEKENGAGDCERAILIDSNEYINGLTDDFNFINVEIIDKCLHITFSASGCDGELWDVDLVDADEIAESFPVQRFAKMTLQNEEDCEAVITQEVSFNLELLEAEGEGSFILNVVDWPGQLIYEY